MDRGSFIVFEGLDGSGKTTQVRLLAQRLRSEGVEVHETFEPTYGPVGSLIHQILNHRLRADDMTIAALFTADRLDHLLNDTDGILRMGINGTTVICDRYYFSSYAYNGVHIPVEWIINANTLSAELLRPNITIFIDAAPKECIRRLNKTRGQLELYESLDRMTLVREKYMEIFRMLSDMERVLVVDGNRQIEDVAKDIWSAVNQLIMP